MAEELQLEAQGGSIRSRAPKCDFGRTYSEIVAGLVAAGMAPSVDAESKIKRWVKRGREVGSIPPLHDLAQMAGWWREMKGAGHFSWRVPDYLIALESGERKPDVAQTPVVTQSSHDSGAGAEDAVDEDDPEAVMTQLRLFAKQMRADMKRAQESGSDSRFWQVYERHQKIAEEIRKWEKVWIERRKSTKELADVAVVKAALSQLLGVCSTAFTNAMFRLARRLAPEKTESELRELVLPERDACFTHLKTSEFADAAKLQAAA